MSRSNKRSPTAEQNLRRWRGCDHKVAFPSKGKAVGRASAIVTRGPLNGMSVYHCRVCHRWHLSTKL